ncbi:RagB/SusD family nutrient uptake outer membrane protein [Fulvivirgaceae bacterium BMA10]|uniref:RagB/SusD family nutrient uptake outer membrane protein n=1 Tax=Splendidivirga corallicola TaxID=3051826 RepID=A0ABT8KGQ5_9BACT|nr:RagB/SusD family nutrient uptake outer membrane protein [Fulvivirgaceae bacterium BMA10]
MKKYIIVLLTIVIMSCDDQLDLNPLSQSSVGNFYKTEADIEQAVVAAYDALQSEGQYGQNFMFFMEIRSDNATVESPTNSSGVFGEFDLFSITPGNSVVGRAWNDCFEGIQRCNIVLNRIESIDMDASLKSIRIGEMKFVRGLTYFNLVRLWGDVPLVITETEDPFDAFDVGRTSVSQIYTQIINDLSDAINALPDTQSEAGRATKGAANTLLGKVYLTLGDYSNAETALRNVLGKYSLQGSYQDIFGIANENNAESIFEIQFQSGFGSILDGGEGSPYPNLVAPVGTGQDLLNGVGQAKGENIPTNDLFNIYSINDQRRDVAIGSTGTIFYAKKLIAPPSADFDSDVNVIVLRYADVLLMLAEVLNEQGYVADGEAFDLLDQVRNRAGLTTALTSADLTDQSSFRDMILNERRREFASENHRWFDLLRTGRALEVMNASTSVFSVGEHQLLYPLPLSAIDAMNNPEIFPQNPGY